MDVNFPIGAAAMDPCLALYCEGVRIDAETQTILDSAPSGADSELQQELARSKTRLKERLNRMAAMNCSAAEIHEAATAGIREMQNLAVTFKNKTAETDRKATAVQKQVLLAGISIEGTNFNAEHYTYEKSLEKDDEDNFTSAVKKDTCNLMIKHMIKGYDKPAVLAIKYGAKVLLGAKPDGENPTRDLLISSTVAVGVGETLTILMKRFPAYKVIATSNIVYDIGCKAEMGIAYLEKHNEIGDAWNRQAFMACDGGAPFASSVLLAKGVAATIKLPGIIFQSIQRDVTTLIGKCADSLGITERHIADMVDAAAHIILTSNPSMADSEFYFVM